MLVSAGIHSLEDLVGWDVALGGRLKYSMLQGLVVHICDLVEDV